MDTTDRTIEDTAEINLEILGGKAICRECTIDSKGSIPELDFRAYSSADPAEFTAHLLKHVSLRHKVRADLLDITLWEEALGVHPRGVRLTSHAVSA